MNLSKPQRALDISAERFGFLRKYTISEESNQTLVKSSRKDVSLDKSKTRIFVRPGTNLNAGDIFHHSLYNAKLAEAFARRSLFYGGDEKYFDTLYNSPFLYGNVLFSNSWIDKYYNRLFLFGDIKIPNDLDQEIDAGIQITRKIFAQAGVLKLTAQSTFTVQDQNLKRLIKALKILLKLVMEKLLILCIQKDGQS